MTEQEFDNKEQSGHIKLKKGFNLNALMSDQGDTFEINFDSVPKEEGYNPDDIGPAEESEVTRLCMGFNSDDEEEDLNTTPFEKIAATMTSVTEDGKIKKKITQPGIGQTPPCDSLVSINYSSYLEYDDKPTDNTYIKKPYTFRLGYDIIFGLNIAVQSMRVNEKALFLIGPDYAFGKMGHPPRIPPNATFLFQIELLRYVDSGPALEFERLSMEDRATFQVVQKTALALMENAKEYFKNHNIKCAIRDYNKARTLLDKCHLADGEEQEKQQKMVFRLLTNLAVCHTKQGNPGKACSMCNDIYKMAQSTSLTVPAKVYFHNGRALSMLGDYERAKSMLLKARALNPADEAINSELLEVSKKITESRQKEKEMAKASLPFLNDFHKQIKSSCDNLLEDSNLTQFKLPGGLTDTEMETAKRVAKDANLHFIENDKEIIISKNKI